MRKMILPQPVKSILSNLSNFFQQNAISALRCLNKETRYKLAAVADIVCMVLIIVNGVKPAQRLISPLVISLPPVFSSNQMRTTKEVFSFAPGLAQNKFDNVDFRGLNILAFFDVPIMDTGEIYNGRAYASFRSSESVDLFSRAHDNSTKVVMTITALDDDALGTIITSPDAQATLADSLISEIKSTGIDGVNIDFEYQDAPSGDYTEKYTQFVSKLTTALKQRSPASLVTVSIPSDSLKRQTIYDAPRLAAVADKLFVVASDTAVPEYKNSRIIAPVFGFKPQDYLNKLSETIDGFFNQVPQEKLVFERAWYGNGDEYPLYMPSPKPDESVSVENDSNIPTAVLDRLISGVPDKAKDAARKNLPYIINALKGEHILNPNVLSYALATIEHETDETFQPIEEIGGRVSARRLGYEGGEDFFGRGFIQLTHLRNYKVMGERIGMGDALVQNPDLASSPEVAAKILAAFFKDNNIANLASAGDFYDARAPVNPDRNAYSVALLAQKFEGSF